MRGVKESAGEPDNLHTTKDKSVQTQFLEFLFKAF